MSVELHGAFVFDCDACGRENFVRVIEADMNQDAISVIVDGQYCMETVAPGDRTFTGDEGREYLCSVLVCRVLLAPSKVTCRHCGSEHLAEIPVIED